MRGASHQDRTSSLVLPPRPVPVEQRSAAQRFAARKATGNEEKSRDCEMQQRQIGGQRSLDAGVCASWTNTGGVASQCCACSSSSSSSNHALAAHDAQALFIWGVSPSRRRSAGCEGLAASERLRARGDEDEEG